MSERRAFKRLPADTEVIIRPLTGSARDTARSKNLSGGGILLSSDRAYQPGTLLEVEVLTKTHRRFARQFAPLTAKVRVVRVEGKAPPYDVAAEFVDVER